MMRVEALPVPGSIPVLPISMVACLGSGEHLRTREGCEGVVGNIGGGKEGPLMLLTDGGDQWWHGNGVAARWRSGA
jgi:hypothetical protein